MFQKVKGNLGSIIKYKRYQEKNYLNPVFVFTKWKAHLQNMINFVSTIKYNHVLQVLKVL